jgi:predicted permease
VGGEVALSVIALSGACLFLRSFRNARQIDLGIDAGRMAIVEFQPGSQGYTQAQTDEFYRRVEERVNTIPGVRAASIAANTPLRRGFFRSVFAEGQESADDRGRPALVNSVGVRYFEAAGIRLLRGRAFNESDREQAQRVAIVNQTMARRFWPGEEIVGKRFRFFGDSNTAVVVGMARDSTQGSPGEEPSACVYLPLRQYHVGSAALIARVDGGPESKLAAIGQAVHSLDPNLPLPTVAAMDVLVDRSLWSARAGASVLAAFAALALVLAAIGLYGLLACTVEDRINEIGIRMALGADPKRVLMMVVGRGLLLVSAGVVSGLVLTVVLARGVVDLLYGIEAYDPVTMLIAPFVLFAVAAAACLAPGRRATRVNPVIALRHQ